MLQKHKNIRRVIINDINVDLIRCYELVRDNPRWLIGRLREIETSYISSDAESRKAMFYAYRDEYNRDDVEANERAALFMFLNHTCFNGLFRVNSKGKYNVPMGRYKAPVICNEEVIMTDHELLNSVDVVIRQPGDYRLIAKNLSNKGQNFVYFDPPYRPLLNESNFKEYSCSPFGDHQQEELKAFCDRLTERNCLIMLSNSDSRNEDGSSYFEELYAGYNYQRIYAPRFINAFAEKRIKLTESLIRNYND